MKTVLLGLDCGNNPSGVPLDPRLPSGKRLAKMARLDAEDFARAFRRVNLSPDVQDDVGRLSSADNLRSVLQGSRVIFLGHDVDRAFTGHRHELFEWHVGEGFTYATFPHPSGRSHWWNSKKNCQQASSFLSEVRKPTVCVEGPDGSGKTTIAKALADKVGFKMVGTEDPPKAWSQCYQRIRRRLKPGIVCDRSSGLVSELVYGPVLRSKTIEDEEMMWSIVGSLIHVVTYVYCRPKVFQWSFRDGEAQHHKEAVTANHGKLVDRYDEVMERIVRMGGRVVKYDWQSDRVEDLVIYTKEEE